VITTLITLGSEGKNMLHYHASVGKRDVLIVVLYEMVWQYLTFLKWYILLFSMFAENL
jgi:hypothetical protein